MKRAKAAKKAAAEHTFASLVKEEESYASEPDPVSASLPPLPQLDPVDAVKLRKVKAHWREDVVGNDGVNRGILDLSPDKVKALTPTQRRYTLRLHRTTLGLCCTTLGLCCTMRAVTQALSCISVVGCVAQDWLAHMP